MTHRSRLPGPLRAPGLLVLLLGLLACSSQPAPLVARAGTTISILVAGDFRHGDKVGYGTPLLESLGIVDHQRGSLQIEIDTRPATADPTLLHPNVVTRVRADPATTFAMDPGSLLSGAGALAGMTQVLAIVDLPADLPAGEWPLRFHRVDAGGQPLSPELPFEHSITILESTGGVEDFNPLRAFFTDLGGSQESLDMEAGGEITSLYPWPKLTILFSGQTPPPAAAHVEMTYPVSRIQSILTVYNDVDPAHDSIVQWQDDGSGTLTLDVVNPRQLRLVLAVVFQPEAGEVLDPATDFALLASSTYDIDGNPGSATVQLDSIQ